MTNLLKHACHYITNTFKIMLAAYYGHAPLVKLLLQHGADPNTTNDRGQSPLAGAVFKNEDEVVEVPIAPSDALFARQLTRLQALLAGGADPDHGAPSAMEAIAIFKQEKWTKKFEEAPGKGKAASASQL